jgi:hypothetical protein
MTKEPGFWRHYLMIHVAVERLVQSEDELRYGARPPAQGFQISLGVRVPGSDVGRMNARRLVGVANNRCPFSTPNGGSECLIVRVARRLRR